MASPTHKQIITTVLIVATTAVLFSLASFWSGSISIGTVENISGIPFPQTKEGIIITEKLAHADLFLSQPVFGQNATLSVTFDPINIEKLELGIRENPFWLSYPKHTLYENTQVTGHRSQVTGQASIPLTDKLRDTNGSVDLMFFTTTKTSTPSENEGISDTTHWVLQDLQVKLSSTMPTPAQSKDFIRSIIRREQPL